MEWAMCVNNLDSSSEAVSNGSVVVYITPLCMSVSHNKLCLY